MSTPDRPDPDRAAREPAGHARRARRSCWRPCAPVTRPGRRRGAGRPCSAFAVVTQVRLDQQDDTYAGSAPADLSSASTASRPPRRAEQDIADLEPTRDSLRNSTQRRRRRSSRHARSSTTLGVLAGTVPAQRPRRPDHGDRPQGRAEPEPPARRDRGAARRRCRGDRDQRRRCGWSHRPPSRTPSAGSSSTARVLKPPYVIDVIGDPETLATTLDFPAASSTT